VTTDDTPQPPAVVASNRRRAWLHTTFSSLQVPNFRTYYLGQTASMVGTWVRRTALGWVIYEMTGSRAMLGTVMGLALLPMFLLSPLAGTIADRVDKRKMVILTQLLASATSAATALLIMAGWAEPWHLMALATIGGIAFAFEVPSRQAFVSDIVGREHLLNAVALNSVLVNSSRVIGPAIAGLIMAAVGAGWCFLLDAISYLIVTVSLLRLKLPPHRPPPHLTSHWHDLLEGFREVHRNRRVRILMLLLCLMGTFGWACQTLMPAIAQDLLHLGEWQYGLLMAMFGVGAIAGALVVAGRTASETSRLQVFGGVWLLCLGAFMVAATRHVVPHGRGPGGGRLRRGDVHVDQQHARADERRRLAARAHHGHLVGRLRGLAAAGLVPGRVDGAMGFAVPDHRRVRGHSRGVEFRDLATAAAKAGECLRTLHRVARHSPTRFVEL
jgi:MFS family permease